MTDSVPAPAPRLLARMRTHAQFLRFLVVGGLNTLFGLAVFGGAVHAGLAVWSALLIGNVAGIAFNFVTTGGLVFRTLKLAQLPRFVGAYALVYVLNLAALHLLARWVPNSLVAQALMVLPMAVLSYLLMKHFVFVAAAPDVGKPG